jgi:hypothetical protein
MLVNAIPAHVAEFGVVARVETTPGIRPITASVLAASTSDPQVF